MTFDRPTNAICGVFFILSGAIFAAQSLSVELGTWLRIGPGGLPLVLSILLALLGASSSSLRCASKASRSARIAWRGMLFILLAPIIFGLTVRRPRLRAGGFHHRDVRRPSPRYKMNPLFALALSVR